MDDATYYEWWDRLTGAKTLEALDAVVAELAATVDVHDPDLEGLAHMAGQRRFALIGLARGLARPSGTPPEP